MPSSSSFISAGFSVQQVTQEGPATIRVRFTQDPMAITASGAADGLNPSLYVLTGAGPNIVTQVTKVADDAQALDLTLSETLLPGNWVLSVSGVVSSESSALQNPTTASFKVEPAFSLPAVSAGAESDSPESIIRKHLPLSFKGKGWESLIAALSVGDKLNWDNAKAAFNQLFKSSAVGKYLDKRAGDTGISRPQDVGINDELFRRLAIKATNKKLIHEVLLEVLEVFYGSDSVRAFTETTTVEPYQIQDGDELEILFDEKTPVRVIFDSSEFARPSQASAFEVAAAITKFLKLHKMPANAVIAKDAVTGKNKVRIYSGTLGLASAVRILGGRSQVQLRFPELVSTPLPSANPSLINWNITIPENSILKWSLNTSAPVNLALVESGDYICAYGSNINPNNKGTYKIREAVTELDGSAIRQYLIVENPNGEAQNFTQLTIDDVLFFRPKKNTPQALGNREVAVSQTVPGAVDVVIPATTQAVARQPGIASYVPEKDAINVTAVNGVNTSIKVVAPNHGLAQGNYIIVDGAASNNIAPTIHPATSGYTSASLASHWFEAEALPVPPTINGAMVSLGNKALVIGGEYINYEILYYNGTISDCAIVEMGTPTTLSDGSIKYAYSQSVTGSLNQGRRTFGATAYAGNSKVFVSGGMSADWVGSTYDDFTILNSTEIYDTQTGTWASGPTMPVALAGHKQVLLDNQKILIAGGMSANNKAHNECYLFDPASNTITATGSMAFPRVDHQMVKLKDGKVLVVGGRTLAVESPVSSQTLALWRMNENGTTINDSGPNGYTLTSSGSGSAASTGKIGQSRIFSGGHLAKSTPSPAAVSALQGEWTLETWVNFPGFSGARTIISFGNSSSSSADNRLLDVSLTWVDSFKVQITIVWENGNGNVVSMSGDITTTSSFWENWRLLSIVKKKNANTPANYDVTVYVNGVPYCTFTNQNNCSDGSNGYWYLGKSAKTGTSNWGGKIDDTHIVTYAKAESEILRTLRRGHGDFFGFAGECLASCEIYDPATGIWTSTGSMALARSSHGMALLDDGRVFVSGGTGYEAAGRISASDASNGIDYTTHKSCEMFTPTSQTWSNVGNMSVARRAHMTEYLPEKNQVLIGFMGGGGDFGVAEIYDVKSKKFVCIKNNLGIFNTSVKSVRLDNGIVLFNGHVEEMFFLPWYDDTEQEYAYARTQWMYIPAIDQISHQNINGLYRITSANDDDFTYQVPSAAASNQYNSTLTIHPAKAPEGADIGPYLFAPDEGAAITSTETTLAAPIYKGQQYYSLKVADATQFPDSQGWLWIGYGEKNQFGPIKYFGRESTDALTIDFSYKIPENVQSGTKVTLLSSNVPFVPTSDSYGAYLTGSSVGRVAAQKQIQAMVAAGINLNFVIRYPSDKGLGNEGSGTSSNKISDKVRVWAGDDIDAEVEEAQEE